MKQTDSLVWVIYDIHKDRMRNKVAKLCKGAGLLTFPVWLVFFLPYQASSSISSSFKEEIY